MKSSKPKDNPSCCVIIKQRIIYSDEGSSHVPDLAMGWIIDDERHDLEAHKQLCDALEQLGFTDKLASRV